MTTKKNSTYLRRNIDSNGRPGDFWCWTNAAGGRISRFYSTKAEALRFPK